MRGENNYNSYPVNVSSSSNAKNGFDYPLTGQDEEWISRKKVETVTKRNLERQSQRQVVLNDGRVIVEEEPEITNDLTEDRQIHEDDGSDDIKMSSLDRAPWTGGKGSTVLGEKFQRNINTYDMRSKAVSTAAAHNLGEISPDGVDKVLTHGRDVRTVVKPYAEDQKYALTIPARVIHKNKSHNRTVDQEDVHEVNRIHEGRLRTDRYVTREVIEDRNNETPEEGSSTESESYDGDAHGYKNRKEERYIDYYKVQEGRPISEGQHVRRGIHMRSQDKDGGKVEGWSRGRNTALTYHDHSDSTSDKPPRPYERKNRKSSRDGHRRVPSSERSLPTTSVRGGISKGKELISNKFHTIERSDKIGKSKNKRKKSSSYFKKNSDGRRQSDSDRSYRSRSMSRSSVENGGGGGGGGGHYGNAKMRSDLDSEREGRLRRAFSFNSRTSGTGNGTGSERQEYHQSNNHKSFLGSMKSLYATIKKTAKKKADEIFEKENNKPARPPRKHQNRNGSTMSNNSRPHSVYSDNATGRSWSGYGGGSLQRTSPKKQATSSQHNLSYSNNNNDNSNDNNNRSVTASSFVDPETVKRGRKVTRRKTMTAFDEKMRENRDPPRFEENYHNSSRRDSSHNGRFFGQDDEVVERERIAPDMRRHLLDGVNLSRKKSMSSKDLDSRPPIRVI